MTQQSAKKEYSTFVKGIITEAGPLTYPENASLDEENCVLNRDGSRQRRLGMDFEDDFVLRSVTVLPTDAVASFRWHNADNNADHQFAVVQVGQNLLVFDASKPSISANLKTTLSIATYTDGTTPIQVASGHGVLFCTGGKTSPFYLAYNAATDTITLTAITINIRDFFGVDDGLAVDEQPAALTAAHQYNLLNQGWSATNYNAYKASVVNKYPSNAQVWFAGKDTSDNFDPALLAKQDFGTSPSPKGRFVISAFDRSTGRQAASGVAVSSDIELSRPTTCAFAYERVFYAGMQSSGVPTATIANMTGYILFSRTIRSSQDFGKCHSDADPTSEYDSELVATDGGYINIPNSGKIHKLMPKGEMLIVFAEGGIWGITGDEGGFRGTSYQVVKLSSFGVLSSTSIVDTEDSAMYWNRGGIYGLQPDGNSGRLQAVNISEGSIQTLYNSIDQVSKKYAIGSFDPINRRVSWMYNDSESYTGATFRNSYTKELVLDLVLGSFYKNSISTHKEPSPYIAGYLETPDFLLREEGIRTRGDSVTKYLVVQFINPPTNAGAVAFGYYRDPTFRDWKSLDGKGASFLSYIITGYEIMEDSMRNKTAQKLVTHFKRTEMTAVDNGSGQAVPDNPSRCIVQTRWDWSDSAYSGKWSEEFQAYRPRPYILTIGADIDYGYSVITNKHTIPGRGRALSILFKSDGDYDFLLYGWAIKFTGQASV